MLYFTMQAQDDDRNGFMDSARTKAKASLGLNITAVVIMVLIWILIVTSFVLNFVVGIAGAGVAAASQP